MSTSEQMAVGIDGLAVYIPRLYIDLTGEWAEVRGAAQGVDSAELVAKLTKGIGVSKMAIPDAHEDSATMAAMAAKRLIDGLEMDPAEIGYLAVATETTVDQSKSIAAYVLGMLQRHYGVDLSHVGCPQFQFACIGGTYALEAATALVRGGDLGDRCAIVIATDVARYPMGGPAECTQGAGAVALRVAAHPRLLRLDRCVHATVSVDERDFFRPNWSAEAVVDGQYSVDVYLGCLDRVLRAVPASAAAGVGDAAKGLMADYYLFHTPFPRMAEYAAARLYRRLESLKTNPDPAAWGDDPAAEREADRATAKQDAFRGWFARHCNPALLHGREVGNIYSGALYLSLGSLVESLAVSNETRAGKRVLFFSYGSGASAKLFAGTFTTDDAQTTGVACLSNDLSPETDRPGGRRHSLGLAEYERLHGVHSKTGEPMGPVVQGSVREPASEFALVRYGTESSSVRVDLGYRYYSFVSGAGNDDLVRAASAEIPAVTRPLRTGSGI
jgi:hydroxymethylglutaryl-CoA synthase